MRNLGIVFVIIISLASCRKDRLEGTSEVLLGKWEWEYTIRSYDNPYIGLYNSLDTIYPSDIGETYQLEFEKDGYVNYFKDNSLTDSYRVVFSYVSDSNCGSGNCLRASIKLNNKKDNGLGLHFINDLLRTSSTNIPTWKDEFNEHPNATLTHIYVRIE